ncbi:polynucleotide adenylyltransferase PcnB [Oceanisphaera avium]|uniref:Poly(A) polymerase I n=1 Tax=Oceanisphaera avium TaxID=1903694 RepID=A0A1Y0CYC3_9GAMM|nr:polynucleotide adenylyltransferase PcnB [Oceanisphaera avium]ART80248.1 polynucleotide adenylyltransferase [Oceanisphaera avium]
MFSQIAGFCKKLLNRTPSSSTAQETLPLQPVILTRDQHGISRQQISDNALKVLYRLNKAGFEAYLVGGGVRDLLLGRQPKDFDIATSATPEQVKALFSNSRLVGRRFRLAHILFGRDVIEVATFRGHHHEVNNNKNISSQSSEGMLLRDNVYGTIEEDAERRDFSVNALYYNIADFSVVGFSNGLQDLDNKRLELIGDPETRYREDPVRMIRAVRFSAKLGLTISPRTAAPIRELAPLLGDIPPARLFEETLKLLMAGYGLETYRLLQHYQLFAPLFPEAADIIGQEDNDYHRFLELALTNTDERIAQGLRVTPAFLYAALLWGPVEMHTQQFMHEGGLNYYDAFLLAMDEVLARQVKSVAIPRRFSSVVRDIWMMQERLTKRSGKRPHRLLEHPKFRAGYDFLLLRAELDPKLQELAQWWTEFQQANPVDRKQLSRHAQSRHNQLGEEPASKRKRPRRRPRKKKEA